MNTAEFCQKFLDMLDHIDLPTVRNRIYKVEEMSGCHMPRECHCKCHVSQNYCCHNCASTNLKNEYISIDVLHTMRQTIEVWQKGCEALIGDLQCRIGVIEKQKFSEFHHLRPDIEKLKTQINSWED